MYRSVLCLTTATPHIGAVGKSVWNDGSRSNDRDCALGERTSRKARASNSADVPPLLDYDSIMEKAQTKERTSRHPPLPWE